MSHRAKRERVVNYAMLGGMRRWWLPSLIWTLGVVAAAVALLLIYARASGPARCEGCPPTGSPWNGWVALIVLLLGLIAIGAGNAILLTVGFARRRRARRARA
jgi:hypothetical protein